MKNLSLTLCLTLFLNLFLAQILYAATPEAISRSASYAITLLGLATFAVSIYLFVVIFQPEKF
ncbi:potassium-transporting ATPase subunit F [Anabaenopsis tanganyikae CS-531]|uniref:Potassium-transporting ATPase subunit F n=2 Tax=Anabaenopsis TaxID=110103 RepID=A0ABT6KCZ1_9CYAN|nr:MULTISPECIES: potassium-transporting ATPase subunit F [Anabaenopsis]MDB9541246.1 potassium-transporting ATPase subunit F [Anabaenopsis arnoldii]MDH6093686.1 potassium-transporting ATPase subunit F [Anabaenopsis arnoldii]MDH6105623.1 potassium-transporting ATPase subunit F [Anabaenopsis tanganyikae CS-531]